MPQEYFIPQSMKSLSRWANSNGGNDKTPKISTNLNINAKSNDEKTWSDFEYAKMQVDCGAMNYVSFSMINSGFTCIDIDHCIDVETGDIKQIATDIISRCKDKAYIEISQSGTGIHIFLKGRTPKDIKTEIEMYSNNGRFIIVTGNALYKNEPQDCQNLINELYEKYKRPEQQVKKTVSTIDCCFSLGEEEILNKIFSEQEGIKWKNLYAGDYKKYGIGDGSRSSASLSLMNKLAFYCRDDKSQMASIFSKCGLYDGDRKMNLAIDKAVSGFHDVYEPKRIASKQSTSELDSSDCVDVKQLLDYKKTFDSNGNIKSQKIIQSIKNFEIVIENDQRFKGKIKYDAFSAKTFLMGCVPWETKSNYRSWSSTDDSNLFSLIQSEYGLTSRNDFFDALKNVSYRNQFNAVKDLLEQFEYKGDGYIRRLLPDYLGCEDNDYTFNVMKLFMLGAVSRIYEPGKKFDYCPIFQGKQGFGKSTFLRLLALDDSFYNDSLDSLDSDKSAQSLMGSWIIELAELKALARTGGGIDSVKRFLSATQDKYRIPYERRADIFPRQCVFAGTTNKSDFLNDETGNRRFLIVQIGTTKPTKDIFSKSVIEDIKSAWAEAIQIYKSGNASLVLPDECQKEAKELQEMSMVDDGKVGIIKEFLKSRDKTCPIEIWQKALGEPGRPQRWQSADISDIVCGIDGWTKSKSTIRFKEYGQQRGFVKTIKRDFSTIYDDEPVPFD